MTWTEGTWIISDSISIAGGYCGILTALFGIIVIIIVCLLLSYVKDSLCVKHNMWSKISY